MSNGSKLSSCDLTALATQCPLKLDETATAYGMPLGACINEPIHWRGFLALDASLRMDWAKAIAQAAAKESTKAPLRLPVQPARAVLIDSKGVSDILCRKCENAVVKPMDSAMFSGCPSSLYCEACMIEIDAMTGEPALLCGDCGACKSLVEDGLFDRIQAERIELRKNFQ